MKMIFVLSALAFLSVVPVHAADEIQNIECHFTSQDSKDQVVISLDNQQSGTFIYTDGSDHKDDGQNTGKIILKRIEDSKDPTKKDYAQFLAKWNTEQEEGWVEVAFDFAIPKSLVLKTSTSIFKANLTTNIASKLNSTLSSSDELACISKLVTKNKI